MEKVLSVVSLTKTFTVKKNAFSANDVISAVNHVTFDLHKREVLGVVGESGCGKSTLARLLIQSIRPDSGEILLNHEHLNFDAPAREIRKKCRKIQMVYQNPYTSLNPKMSVTDNITFGPIANGIPRRQAEQKALDYLAAVGMKGSYAHLYPHNLSGGQRQRVAIARALAMEPEIILADEPVSALDKSVQAQVLNLFQELKERFSLSIVFISHDLSVVEYMSDTILVMYLGEVVERGAANEVYAHPRHPYTRELLAAIPDIGEGLRRDQNETPTDLMDLPSPINPPSGCRFHPRCPHCTERCKKTAPGPVAVGTRHTVYCHYQLDK